jgi:hypothetical protein
MLREHLHAACCLAACPAIVAALLTGTFTSDAAAKEPLDLHPQTDEGFLRYRYGNLLPSLDDCGALAERRGQFGEVYVHFSGHLGRRVLVRTTKSLGPEVQKCLLDRVAPFAGQVYRDYGRKDDFAYFTSVGKPGAILADDARLIRLWVDARFGRPEERSSARAALLRLLPPDVRVVNGCLTVVPAGVISGSLNEWLTRQDEGDRSALGQQ